LIHVFLEPGCCSW